MIKNIINVFSGLIKLEHRFWLPLLLINTTFVNVTIKAQEQQNVLFIAIDDLKTIGSLYSEEESDLLRHIYPDDSLRHKVVERMTPNLQRLADQSVTFMNAYTASPACNPSRAALMTGIRPHKTGLVQNEGGLFFRTWEYEGERPLAEATTLPELLKTNGWYTAETGKIFHGQGSLEKADGHRSWTDWTHVDEGAGGMTLSPYSPPSLKWGVKGDRSTTVDQQNDNRAADFIARLMENGQVTNDETTFMLPEDKPFFLACGIFKPHLPFATTQDMLDLFPVEEMNVTRELLQYFIDDASDLPPLGLSYSGCKIDDNGDPVLNKDRFIDVLELGLSINSDDGDLDGWKDMLKHYFACVATADRAVGRLLDGLENSPYANNTMVILWSDHGYHLGEKIHVSKFTFWDDGARVYFMIKDPRNPQSSGKRCYQPVSLIDIYPTVARMAGLELPDVRITGRDLQPFLENPGFDWAAPSHTTFRTPESHMVRDDQYKLIRYEGNNSETELYDMFNDGEEYFNLAEDSEYDEVLKKMKHLMEVAINEGDFENLYDSTVKAVGINNCPGSMYTGTNHYLTALVIPSNARDQTIKWSSSDSSVVIVDTTGLVTALKEGTATITITSNDGGLTDECAIEVIFKNSPVLGVTIGNCPQSILETGDRHQLKANINPADANDTKVTWISSVPRVASVDSNGMVTAMSQGSATIMVITNDGGHTNSCYIGVKSTGIPINGVNVTGCALENLYIGDIHPLGVNISPANARDLNVSWNSSDTSIAKVDAYGWVTAVSAGNSIITAVTIDGGYTDECIVSVIDTSLATKINWLEPPNTGVKVYPNPVTHKLFFDFPDSELEKRIKLFNLQGQLLQTFITTNSHCEMDIKRIKAGQIVFVVILSGERKTNFKFILQ